jgi:hypothetical protein
MPGVTLSFRHAAVLSGLLVAGFVIGSFPRSEVSPPPQSLISPAEMPSRASRASSVADWARRTFQNLESAPPSLSSDDTVDDLLAVHSDDLYERLALWLVDAGSDEICEFFHAALDRSDLQIRHFDLLFVRWTATDPMGAIEAAKGTDRAHIPWSHPEDALSFALETNRAMVEWVIMSVGQENPDLAFNLIAQHPDLPDDHGFYGIVQGLMRDDPQAALEFALEREYAFETRPLEKWLREDPQAAFAWFLEKRSQYPRHSSPDQMVIDSLSRENPAALTELLERTPPGSLRRKMEAALFDQLVANDLGTALAQARTNPSPMTASDGLSKVGLLLLESDPEMAHALLKEVLAFQPDPARRATAIYHNEGTTDVTFQEVPEARRFLMELAKVNPEHTLTDLISDSSMLNHSATMVATQWAKDNVVSFEEWVTQHPNIELRSDLTNLLVHQYMNTRDFAKALSHLEQVPENHRNSLQMNIIYQWRHHDPKAARDWVELSGLSESLGNFFDE